MWSLANRMNKTGKNFWLYPANRSGAGESYLGLSNSSWDYGYIDALHTDNGIFSSRFKMKVGFLPNESFNSAGRFHFARSDNSSRIQFEFYQEKDCSIVAQGYSQYSLVGTTGNRWTHGYIRNVINNRILTDLESTQNIKLLSLDNLTTTNASNEIEYNATTLSDYIEVEDITEPVLDENGEPTENTQVTGQATYVKESDLNRDLIYTLIQKHKEKETIINNLNTTINNQNTTIADLESRLTALESA